MEDRIQKLADKALSALSDSLESGHSQTLTAYLKAMARFHRYSWFNSLLIWVQKPEATFVAGYRKWNEVGRHVRQGQKGISILAPVVYKTRQDPPDSEESEIPATGFIPVCVFDVSQTEGDPLPEIGKRTGNPGVYGKRLLAFACSMGFAVTESPNLRGAQGLSRGASIQILQSLSPAEKFGVLAHEIAHSMLHFGEGKTTKSRVVLETEAEAVAFVVSEAIGLANSTASRDYLHLYQSDAQMLMASLATVRNAASQILKAILV